MAADGRILKIKCSSCGSGNIKCTDLQEILYKHLIEIKYECLKCGHNGTFTLDCVEKNELQIFIK